MFEDVWNTANERITCKNETARGSGKRVFGSISEDKGQFTELVNDHRQEFLNSAEEKKQAGDDRCAFYCSSRPRKKTIHRE